MDPYIMFPLLSAGVVGAYSWYKYDMRRMKRASESDERANGTYIPDSEKKYASGFYKMLSKTITDLGDGSPHPYQSVREIVEETADMYSNYLGSKSRMHDIPDDKIQEMEIFLKKHGIGKEEILERDVVYVN